MKTEFKPVLNEQTGQTDFNFAGRIISIGETVLANSNGKEYVVGTVEFTNPAGVKTQSPIQIYKKSLDQGMVADRQYLCTLSKGLDKDGKPAIYIRGSHLVVSERADVADFASLWAEEVPAGNAGDMA